MSGHVRRVVTANLFMRNLLRIVVGQLGSVHLDHLHPYTILTLSILQCRSRLINRPRRRSHRRKPPDQTRPLWLSRPERQLALHIR
jgi:hypothetical protein